MYPRTSESRLVTARPTLSTGIERVVVGAEQGRRSGDVAHGNDGSVGALYRVGSVHIVANIRRVQV